MDNLARNCMLAKQANMSYGKWKALQPIVPYEKKEVIPEGWKKCLRCGKVFKPSKNAQKYCDIWCRNNSDGAKEKKKAYNKMYYERKKQHE